MCVLGGEAPVYRAQTPSAQLDGGRAVYHNSSQHSEINPIQLS